MNVTVEAKSLEGNVTVCASKSEDHRLLICAFLSFDKTDILCGSMSEDIEATINCIEAMGASVTRQDGIIRVDSSKLRLGSEPVLDCGESGSTLRFIIPVVCALGLNCTLVGHGRLPQRPNKPLIEALSAKGIDFDKEDGLPLKTCGRLRSGVYEIAGNISSQYISGLLFALPLLDGDSVIKLVGGIESKPYIMITVETLERFGISVDFDENACEIRVKGGQKYITPNVVKVNGDWSNGAFWLAAAAISDGQINCEGLVLPTKQGDSVIKDIIPQLRQQNNHVIIDASQFPDLVPIISVLAAARQGQTTVCGAARLKIKESNRIESVVNMINNLGGSAVPTDEGIIVNGTGALKGGTVDSCGDHRIVMSAAVAALICEGNVKIEHAEAVSKSYPAFFDEMEHLGASIERSDG